MNGALVLVVAAVLGSAPGERIDGTALRREAAVLAALADRGDGPASRSAALDRLEAAFRVTSLEVRRRSATELVARLAGRDERLRAECLVVRAGPGADPASLAALPALARALAGAGTRRSVVFSVGGDDVAALRKREPDLLPEDGILVAIEIRRLEGSAGRPSVSCVATPGMTRVLHRARRPPDVFLRIRPWPEGPGDPPERIAIRVSREERFATSGPPTDASLGRAADFCLEVLRILAAGGEDPPLGLAGPGEEATAETLLARAHALAKARRFTEALGLSARALVEAPDSVEARLFRGRVLLDLNRPESARAEAEAALLARPGDPEALVLLGRSTEALGDEATALRAYDLALVHRTDDLEARARRGLLRVRRGEVAEGVEDLDAVLAADAKNAVALKGLGMARYYRRSPSTAIESLRQATRLDPDDWEGWLYLGLARVYPYFVDGRESPSVVEVRRAVEAFTNAITADPSRPLPYEYRGRLHRAAGRLESARADLDRAIELRPGRANLRLERGKALLALNRTDAAIEDFREALRLEPGRIDPAYQLARAHARLRRMDAAVQWLGEAIVAGLLDDWMLVRDLRRDPDLQAIRRDPRVRRLLRGNRAD